MNSTIEKLEFSLTMFDYRITKALASWLTSNKSLKDLSFWRCHGDSQVYGTGMGSAEVNVLSNALSKRSGNSLERFSLNSMTSHPGNIDLKVLVPALMKHTKLKYLGLVYAEIGRRGCTSIAKLLEYPKSILEELDLSNNQIDDGCAIMLANSLSQNRTLTKLEMKFDDDDRIDSSNGPFSRPVFTAMLKLVCNTSSVTNIVKSNHTLAYLGFGGNWQVVKSSWEKMMLSCYWPRWTSIV